MEESRKKNIFFITVRADWGGGPEHLWRLLQNLPSDFVPFIACPMDKPYYHRYVEIVGEENIFIIPHRAFRFNILIHLHRWCKKNNIQLIHSHGKGAGLYARLLAFSAKIPCIHTPHGVHIKTMGFWKQKMYLYYEHLASLCSVAIISVSAGELDQIIKLKFSPKNKVKLIPNGVQIPLNPIEISKHVPFRVIHISRFDIQKNSEYLLNILGILARRKVLNQFKFEILGDGDGRNLIESEISERGFGDAIVFHGFLPNPDSFFNQALCLLSTSCWEGLPLAVLEAMAHGLVPVVSDVVGNRDAVRHGITGLLYPLEDADKACDHLCKLASNKQLLCTLSKAARNEAIEKFSLSICTQKTFNLYNQVLGL